MRSREEEREDRRRYENDVFYEVWRSGRNPDAINYDRVDEHHYNGDSVECATRHELRAQTPQPREMEEEQ